jgi:hypothetical protein
MEAQVPEFFDPLPMEAELTVPTEERNKSPEYLQEPLISRPELKAEPYNQDNDLQSVSPNELGGLKKSLLKLLSAFSKLEETEHSGRPSPSPSPDQYNRLAIERNLPNNKPEFGHISSQDLQ